MDIDAESTVNIAWNSTNQPRDLSDALSNLVETITTTFELDELDLTGISLDGDLQTLAFVPLSTVRLFAQGSLDVGPLSVSGTVAAQVQDAVVDLYVSGDVSYRQVHILPSAGISATGFARVASGGIEALQLTLNAGAGLTLFGRDDFALQGSVDVTLNTTGNVVNVPPWAVDNVVIPAGRFAKLVVEGGLRFAFLDFETGQQQMRMELNLDLDNEFLPRSLNLPFSPLPLQFDDQGNVGFEIQIGPGSQTWNAEQFRTFLIGMGLDSGPADWISSTTTTLQATARLEGYTPGFMPTGRSQTDLMRDGGIEFDFAAGVSVAGLGELSGEFAATFSPHGVSGSVRGTASVLGISRSISGTLEPDGCATVDLLSTTYSFPLTATACAPAFVVSAPTSVIEGDKIEVVVRAFNLSPTLTYDYIESFIVPISVTSSIGTEVLTGHPLSLSIQDGTAIAVYEIDTVNRLGASGRDLVITVGGGTVIRYPLLPGLPTEVVALKGYPDRGRTDGAASVVVNVLDRDMVSPGRPANAAVFYDFGIQPFGPHPQSIPMSPSYTADGWGASLVTRAAAVATNAANGLAPDPDTGFFAAIQPLNRCFNLPSGDQCGIHFEFSVPGNSEATQVAFWDKPNGPLTKWIAHVEYSTSPGNPFTVEVTSGDRLTRSQIPNLSQGAVGWRKNEFELPFDGRAFYPGIDLGPQLRDTLYVKITLVPDEAATALVDNIAVMPGRSGWTLRPDTLQPAPIEIPVFADPIVVIGLAELTFPSNSFAPPSIIPRIDQPGGTIVSGNLINPIRTESNTTLYISGPLTIGNTQTADSTQFGGTVLIDSGPTELLTIQPISLGSLMIVGAPSSPGTLVASGGLTVQSGALLAGTGTISNTQPISNRGAVMGIGSGLNILGPFQGAGRLGGPITFFGGTSFGNSPADVTAYGPITFADSNRNHVEIGGTSAGDEYDRLTVHDQLILGGTLFVEWIDLGNSYQPNSGDRFEIFRFAQTSGAFSEILLPPLDPSLSWQYVEGPNNIELVITSNAMPLSVQRVAINDESQQRSHIRNIDVVFNSDENLDELLADGRVRLTKMDLNGENAAALSLPSLTIADQSLRFDFGSQGLGGNRNSNLGDGYYHLELDLDGDGSFDFVHRFYRLLGDVNGDGVVDADDRSAVMAAMRSQDLSADVNGDGVINSVDFSLVSRAIRRKLKDGLWIDE